MNSFFFPRSPFYPFCSLLKSLSLFSTFESQLNCLLNSLRAESRENWISTTTITTTILTTTSTKMPASGPTYSDLTPMATGKWSVLLRPPPLLPIKGHCCYGCPLSHMCHQVFCLYWISPPSCKMLDWMKLESRLPGEISITSDMQMTPLLWQKVKKN